MLKIIIELHPFGDEKQKKTIGEITISNSLKQNEYFEHKYNYDGWAMEQSGRVDKFKGTVWHNRINHIFILLYKILHIVSKPYQ